MLYLPNDKMFPNKFVEVSVPTKREIFARTGQFSNSAGTYSGEDSEVHFKDTPTSGLERLARDAESFSKDESSK